ncbi:MAG TPA: hypothetical protein VL283_00360, partial [Candidatus Baltobacteraceae bacterium]|nr:hypothetical protein [Candidatus Baltobacteraceae bacterium]
MDDRALIEALYDGTIPRIKDIRDAVSTQADEDLQAQIDAGEWPMLAGLPNTPPDPAMEKELTRIVWSAPLTDMAVQLVRTAQGLAVNGTFIVDVASVAAVCAAMDDAELKRDTGIDEAHLRPVLEKMAEAFIEIVRKEGVIHIDIDRRPLIF